MNRQELLLVILASANGLPFTPVQVQKAVFLVTKNAPSIIDDGEPYEFSSYDYGPFDSSVYVEAGALEKHGLAVTIPSAHGRWKEYAATADGCVKSSAISANINPAVRKYIDEVVLWVRKQSFASLVKSIYEMYPEMKQNSIFKF